MTKELIERITQAREHTQLYGQVLPALWVYQPFTMNAGELFSAIEALQARVVELGDELERERICHAACGVIALSNTPESAATMRQMKDEYRSASVQDVCNAVDREMALRVERDSLAAELAAARAQAPVSHRYRFSHPISGEPVWRDSSSTWNGQCVQEVQPLFAAPIPPVREPVAYMSSRTGATVTKAQRQRMQNNGEYNKPLVFAAATPPVREPLTDAEIEAIARAHGTGGWQTLADMQTFARAIEAAIKEQK